MCGCCDLREIRTNLILLKMYKLHQSRKLQPGETRRCLSEWYEGLGSQQQNVFFLSECACFSN